MLQEANTLDPKTNIGSKFEQFGMYCSRLILREMPYFSLKRYPVPHLDASI